MMESMMPTEKTEDLFKLSNAALKERLKAEGIEFETDDNKKTLVARLNGDFKESQSQEDVAAEAANLGGLSGQDKPEEQNPVVSERGEEQKSEATAGEAANVEVTTAQKVSDAEQRKNAEGGNEPEKLIGLEGVSGDIELIDGNKIHVDEVVKEAFATSGLTVTEWNGLTDLERWRFATPVLDVKQQKLYEERAAREDAAAGKAPVEVPHGRVLADIEAENRIAAASEVGVGVPVTEASNPDVVTAGTEEPEESKDTIINRLELEKGSLQAIVNNQSEQITKLTTLLEDANKQTAKLTKDLADTQLNIDRAATLHGHIDDLPKLD